MHIGCQMPTHIGSSLVVQPVKNPPEMQDTWDQSLGWGDPLEEDMATHASILAWRIPMNRGGWQSTAHGVTKSCTQLTKHIYLSDFFELLYT